VNPEAVVFLDETGLKTNLTRLRGWAFGGQRLVEAVPAGHWETSTLVHAISLHGTRAAMVLDGPINATSFSGFCKWLLAPALSPGEIVIMDNLSSHKSASAVATIESAGARVVYLPPYSPDLNPIEMAFSKLKQIIRAAKPRALDEIVAATRRALLQLTQSDLDGFFNHCGYVTT
jgi:transposase